MSFIDFKTFIQRAEPLYRFSPTFNEKIIVELEAFLSAYYEGANPRKILKAPPQTGKSTLIELFIAYVVCISMFYDLTETHPNGIRIIIASYSSHIAKQRIKGIKKYLDDFIFNWNLEHSKEPLPSKFDVDKADELLLTRKFHIKTAGIGGALTGFSGDLLFLDDYVKSLADALSPKFKEKVLDWFSAVFDTRKQQKYGQFVLSTQWNKGDLLDSLEDRYGFEVMNFPAVYRDDKGEEHSICPEIKSLEFFKEIEAQNPAYIFSALYLGNPVATKGSVFKEEVFRDKFFKAGEFIGAGVGKYDRVFIVADTALKNGEQHDFSVFSAFVARNGSKELHMIDMMRLKVEGVELEEHFSKFYTKICDLVKRQSIMCLIEDKASGTVLIQSLRRNLKLNIKPIKRNKLSKVTRGLQVTHLMPHLHIAEHIKHDVLRELLEFNFEGSSQHDDICDTIFDGLAFWENPQSLG